MLQLRIHLKSVFKNRERLALGLRPFILAQHSADDPINPHDEAGNP